MFPLLRTSLNNNHDLPLRLMFLEPGRDLSQSAPPMFLMDLGNLPCHRAKPVGSEIFSELVQSLDKTVRRLVKDHGPRFFGERLQHSLPSLFDREEPLKAEPVARKARRYYRRNTCGRTRKCLYLNTFSCASTNQQKTRIRNPGSTGIADQSDILSSEDTLFYQVNSLMLVELVVGPKLPMDVITLQ